MGLRKKNNVEIKDLSKDEVIDYLIENPNFINDNVDILNQLFSLNKNEGNIISFEDIRIKSLINENNSLNAKISEIIKNAEANEIIQNKLYKFANELISKKDINELPSFIMGFVKEEFPTLNVGLGLLNIKGFDNLDKKYFDYDTDLINEVFLQKNPILLTNKYIRKYGLDKFKDEKCSIVMCPLGLDFPTGIMFIKYNSTMIEKNHQFDLLSSLAQTVSFSFNQFIQGQ